MASYRNWPDAPDHISIGDVLGVGSVAEVRSCVYKGSSLPLAVKCIDWKSFQKLSKRSKVKMLESEMAILKLVDHPNILKLYDICVSTSGNVFIVAEKATGGELYDYIDQEGPLDFENAIRVFSQVALAVSYLHSLLIAHRDLKVGMPKLTAWPSVMAWFYLTLFIPCS